MSLLKSLIYGESEEIEQNFCEYSDTFLGQPVLISCDLNFNKLLPANDLNCCVKIQMDVFVRPDLPTLINESEHAHISTVRSILGEHIGGRFVGQGIIAASSAVFLMFYIPERQARACKKMLTETFMGSFRHMETSIVPDPEGLQYKKYLYPSELQIKRINNTKILRTLRTYGDNGSIPRSVKFNLVFSNKNAALACYSESMAKGFAYTDIITEPPPEGMVLPRYRLILEKTIPFNLELLMLIDDYLMKLAEKFEGEYRSLETNIIEL